MEALLNTIWFVVSLAAVALWCARVRSAHGLSLATKRREVVALACLIVLLFFVISVSDDLRLNEALVEESGSSRTFRTSLVNAAGHVESQTACVASAILRELLRSHELTLARLTPAEMSFEQIAFALPHEGRAPPSSLL